MGIPHWYLAPLSGDFAGFSRLSLRLVSIAYSAASLAIIIIFFALCAGFVRLAFAVVGFLLF